MRNKMNKQEINNRINTLESEIQKLRNELNKSDTIHYCGFDFYAIDEDDRTKTLVSKECLDKYMIIGHFNKYSVDYDVKFGFDKKNWRWSDSYIRHVLNSAFLNKFYLDELEVMTTTVELDNEKSTTRDYVRLLTKDEVEKLSEQKYAGNDYWTMSPSYFYGSNADVFVVPSIGFLYGNYVNYAHSVRFVIKVKKEALNNAN